MSQNENIVKDTCKELGIAQKELAPIIGVDENTVSRWSTGKVDTPLWATKMFVLLIKEKKLNKIVEIVKSEI